MRLMLLAHTARADLTQQQGDIYVPVIHLWPTRRCG